MSETHVDVQGYEAPAIVVIGPVEELTLGSQPGEPGDGSATYSIPF
jgi:hypothetical protein